MNGPDTHNDDPTIVFVYNADRGLIHTLADIGHKILSPDTYACRLCELTHGYFTMRGEWKAFIDALGVPCEFLHHDEFVDKYGDRNAALPAVFRKVDGDLELCLSAEAINGCEDLQALETLVTKHCKK